jgi:hypothetical protein
MKSSEISLVRVWCEHVVQEVCDELLERCVCGADELAEALEDVCDAVEDGEFSSAARLLRKSWNTVPWSVQHDVQLKLAPLVVGASVLCAVLADSESSGALAPGRVAVDVARMIVERGQGDTAAALIASLSHTATMADVEEMLLAGELIVSS